MYTRVSGPKVIPKVGKTCLRYPGYLRKVSYLHKLNAYAERVETCSVLRRPILFSGSLIVAIPVTNTVDEQQYKVCTGLADSGTVDFKTLIYKKSHVLIPIPL